MCLISRSFAITFWSSAMGWLVPSLLPGVEGLFVGDFGAVFGLGGCLLSLRQHRDLRPLCLVVAGLALNAVGRFAKLQLGPHLSLILIVDGPLLMFYGLWKDRRLCQCSGHAH